MAFYNLKSGSVQGVSKKIIGGKAHNLVEMHTNHIKIPSGFVTDVEYCFNIDFPGGEVYGIDSGYAQALNSHIRHLAQQCDATWAKTPMKGKRPLLVSVRSGAPISMPGMMDTILNIGLTRKNIKNFVESYGTTASMAFGYDCYRRLIQMYGITVKGIDPEKFTEIFQAAQTFWGTIGEEEYKILIDIFLNVYKEECGEDFPDDPNVQLLNACNAVYKSWFNPKAVAYRNLENIDHKMGTAVTVQQMVFGNMNEHSATGVVFTHNPNSGVKGWYGDFLVNAQGEDVVAGTHEVRPIEEILSDDNLHGLGSELQKVLAKLYNINRNILDVEFTIEDKALWILQYRVAKCSKTASVRSLMDMVREAHITSDEATQRFIAMLPEADKGAKDSGDLSLLGKGLGATDGVVVGHVAVGHVSADRMHKKGIPYIYVAKETAPDDIEQMKHAIGILTKLGGSVSHAVVVARAWDKTCVVSFNKMEVKKDRGFFFDGQEFKNGALIKINGATGEVWG